MTKEVAQRLRDELAAEFKAHVEIEEISPGRFRFEVFSRYLGNGSQLERHDRGWQVVDRVLTREQIQDISLLLMYGPEDVDAAVAAIMPS